MREFRLKDLGRWSSGGTPPRDIEELWTGEIPWISAKDINRATLREPSSFITREAAVAHSRLVPSGGLLMIVRGMALANGLPVVQVDHEVAFNQDLRALVTNKEVDSRFAYYALLGNAWRLNRHIDRAAHGTARLTDSVYSERLHVLDPAQQAPAARFLDRECQRISALHDELTSTADLVRSHATAEVEREIFIDGSDEWFGARRRDWTTRPLASIGALFDGDWIEAPYIADEGIRLIQTGNIGRATFHRASERFISSDTFMALNCSAVMPGDVLFSRLNQPVGRACVAPGDIGSMIAAVDIAVMRPALGVLAEFLVALASTDRWLGHLAQLGRGTTMPRIARSGLGRVRVPIPPLDAQERIASRHGLLTARWVRLRTEVAYLQRGLAEYRDALITDVVGGRLDVARISEQQLDESAWAAAEGGRPEVLSA